MAVTFDAFDLLQRRIVTKPHLRVEVLRAFTLDLAVLRADAIARGRERHRVTETQRHAALNAAELVLKNPSAPFASDAHPEARNAFVEDDLFVAAGRQLEASDIARCELHGAPMGRRWEDAI